jgi:hypothetical protein
MKFVVPLNCNALMVVAELIVATAVLLLENENAPVLFETGDTNANELSK